jgi:hypothetical protein
MSYARQLLDTYPGTLNVDSGTQAATIEALNDCAQACSADADADLSEQNVTEMASASGCAWTASMSAPPLSQSQAARRSSTLR